MRRGTTPTHQFELPFETDLLKDIEITYQQSGKIILQKHKEDCDCIGSCVSVTLTQEETFLFRNELPVEIQTRVLTDEHGVLASDIYRVSCERCLSDEVLG
jgi:hypothetical protein